MTITFEDLEKDPMHRPLIALAEKKHGSPLPQKIKNLMVESTNRSIERVSQTERWANLLHSSTSRIVKGSANEAEYPLFWIYLYGALFEMSFEFEQQQKKFGIPTFLRPVQKLVTAICSSFSGNEFAFIKFMRHNHVHLHLDYYYSKVELEGRQIVKIKTPLQADAPGIAENIITAHQGKQNLVATEYANRIVKFTGLLVKAISIAQAPV